MTRWLDMEFEEPRPPDSVAPRTRTRLQGRTLIATCPGHSQLHDADQLTGRTNTAEEPSHLVADKALQYSMDHACLINRLNPVLFPDFDSPSSARSSKTRHRHNSLF